MIGSSKVGPLVRTITKGRTEVNFDAVVKQIHGVFPGDLRPIERAIVEAELDYSGFRRRSGTVMFVRQ
jgi:hypothetical protein